MYGIYRLTYWPIIFLFAFSFAGSNLSWHLTTPAIYGRNVTLQCDVPDGACSIKDSKFWSGGKNYTLLCFEDVCQNSLKYKMISTDENLAFQLVILNFSESDVISNYSCTCGFWHGTKAFNSVDRIDYGSFVETRLIIVIVCVVVIGIVVFLVAVYFTWRAKHAKRKNKKEKRRKDEKLQEQNITLSHHTEEEGTILEASNEHTKRLTDE